MSDKEIKLSLLNIDLQPLADVGTALLEKLSSAIGWVATNETPRRIAVDQYIESIKNNPHLDSLLKAALISQAEKTVKEYCNQYEVVQFALEHFHESQPIYADQLSEDWLTSFMDKARLASDQTVQRLWGQILAQECVEPNSVPKHLLTILTSVDRNLATAFSMVKSHSILLLDSEPKYYPIINHMEHPDHFDDHGLTIETLSDLDAIGLISYESIPHTLVAPDVEFCKFQYGNRTFEIDECAPDISLGQVNLTTAGEKLCHIIGFSSVPAFVDECLPDIDVDYHEL